MSEEKKKEVQEDRILEPETLDKVSGGALQDGSGLGLGGLGGLIGTIVYGEVVGMEGEYVRVKQLAQETYLYCTVADNLKDHVWKGGESVSVGASSAGYKILGIRG